MGRGDRLRLKIRAKVFFSKSLVYLFIWNGLALLAERISNVVSLFGGKCSAAGCSEFQAGVKVDKWEVKLLDYR